MGACVVWGNKILGLQGLLFKKKTDFFVVVVTFRIDDSSDLYYKTADICTRVSFGIFFKRNYCSHKSLLVKMRTELKAIKSVSPSSSAQHTKLDSTTDSTMIRTYVNVKMPFSCL